MIITARGHKFYHFQEPPAAGQELRESAGAWERATNAQQRRLVETYDAWASKVYTEMLGILARKDRTDPRAVEVRPTLETPPRWWVNIGYFPYYLSQEIFDTEKEARKRAKEIKDWLREQQRLGSETDLESYLIRLMPELELNLSAVVEQGIIGATSQVLRGQRMGPTPGVLSTQNRAIQGSLTMVRTALIPHIQAGILADIKLSVDTNALWQSFVAMRSRVAQYAGGYWVMIFEVEKEIGQEKDRELVRQGLPPEPVRWVLDPEAEHCKPSAGFYGCPELAGEYPGGWYTLPTVPAGQVTCRGTCRCRIEVYKDGKWKRGI